jgi:hypothetical protein
MMKLQDDKASGRQSFRMTNLQEDKASGKIQKDKDSGRQISTKIKV